MTATACLACKTEFTPKPRRNQHSALGAHGAARYCSDRCRLRAHRARNANVRPVQRASQTGIEGAVVRETLAGGGMCHPIRETPLETPTKRESKPLPSGIVPDAKWPGMYRLRLPDGSLSVMVNLTRAKDALRWRLNGAR
jgi:hypothetical protein